MLQWENGRNRDNIALTKGLLVGLPGIYVFLHYLD